MPFNGSGTYAAPALPGTWNPASSGSTIDPTDWNTLLADFVLAYSTAICKDGQTVLTNNIPFNNFRITGLGAGTSSTDAATVAQATGFLLPQGRLTLTTATPVLTANVSAAGTVYYTPYVGPQVPVYDGTRFSGISFTELSNVLANSSSGNAGPAAGAASKNYDLFVWSNGGTATLTRGGAWNSDTSRSATTENDLVRTNGVLLNLNTITNGPAASRGTYVGTIRTDVGGATVSWHTGALGAGGTAATLNVWNAYNRVSVMGCVADTTDAWTYAGGAFRAADNSSTMRVSFVNGLQEDWVVARFDSAGACNGGFAVCSVGLNSTTTPASGATRSGNYLTGAFAASFSAAHQAQVLGFNYLQALENNATATATFYGDNGSAVLQTGFFYEGRF